MPIEVTEAERILRSARNEGIFYFSLGEKDEEGRVHEITLITRPFNFDTSLKVRLAERTVKENTRGNCTTRHTLYNFGRFDKPDFKDVFIVTALGVTEDDIKNAVETLRKVEQEITSRINILEEEENKHIERLLKKKSN